MKNDLIYQSTDYTCAPTTVFNALRYLYEREELRPDVVWSVFTRTMDNYDPDGTFAGNGTSPSAMLALMDVLNMYGETGRFPIRAQLYRGDQALAGAAGSPLRTAIQDGGAGMARIWSNKMNGHYVLVTGFSRLPDGQDAVEVFDPYLNSAVDEMQVQRIENKPGRANRLISVRLFDGGERRPYALVNDEHQRRVIIVDRGDA